jgi:hypothetical protein
MPRFIVLLFLLVTSGAHAQQDFSGVAPSGATYRVVVPAGWQAGGPLVMYQHGFNFSEASGAPGLGPLRDVMLAEGYAVAATSFSQRGWAVFRAMDDNRELLDIFTDRVGTPGEIIPWGGSLGGLLALKLAEAPGFPPVRGVMAMCPAAAGSRLWDQALDLRLAYNVVCAGAGDFPRGAEPLPWAYNLRDIPDDLDDLTDQARLLQTLLPLNQCTGINLLPSLRSSDKKRRLAELMRIAGTTDEKFFITNIAYATYALSELVRAPDKLAGRNAMSTIGVDYGDPQINTAIARIAADPLAALQLQWYSNFRGEIGSAKVMSLHTSRDQLVVPANQDVLRRKLPASQLASAIVAETSPTHCGFNFAEGLAGWEALREWVDGHTQPSVADLQQRCEALVAAGNDGPCRFDPAALVPSLDSAIRPRSAPNAAPVDARYSGQWFDPSRSGEGIVLEVLPGDRALVYFFTYPPQGTSGSQAWLVGTGAIVGNGIAFDQMLRPQMRATDSGEVFEQSAWGSMWLSFDDCQSGHMRWEGPQGWGKRDVTLRHLTALHGLGCGQTAPASAQASGAWFDRRFYGSGFVVEQLDANRNAILWFSPGDAARGQMWMTGVVEGDLASGISAQTLYRPHGTYFGDAFNSAQLLRSPGMQLDARMGCNAVGSANYVTTIPAPGSGTPLDLRQITRPLGVSGCPQ